MALPQFIVHLNRRETHPLSLYSRARALLTPADSPKASTNLRHASRPVQGQVEPVIPNGSFAGQISRVIPER
jgi:hypothetical protein